MPQTGATRYQKFLKSEKAKTKLKAKKDLPKGTNVTKTNFKVKKIVIKEQLKKRTEKEALSIRKLNVKELITRLNHFNTNTRKDALDGLTELISTHPEILEKDLGLIIHGVSPMILNVEKIVRHESLKVLHLILSNLSVEKIDPFFDVMSTFLRSAMTHINSRIQEDSLLFLDILLLCAPMKMAKDFYRIIPNFLDMISKLHIDSKPGRTLTVNMESQITSVRWRSKVLHRLQDYLQKFVIHNKVLEFEKPITECTEVFDQTKLKYYPLFKPTYTSVCYLKMLSSKNSQEIVSVDEVEQLKGYIDNLMPLLFEIWLEVCPNMNKEKNIETVVSEDAASLLKHSLEIIFLLWDLIEHLNKKNPSSDIESSFCQKYKNLYTLHFVNAFPYVTNVRTKQNSDTSLENVITDSKLVLENLKICHLFILLNPKINLKLQNKDIVAILHYIEKTFNHNTKDEVNDAIIEIMHTIFSTEVSNWSKTCSVMDGLFRKIIWAYFNKNMSGSWKQKIFGVLCKVALNDKLSHFHANDAYEMWLKNLPDILLGSSVTEQTIDIIHKFAVQSNDKFNIVIKPKLSMIIENLPNIVSSEAANNPNMYYKLFSLFFWIRPWDNESLNVLEKQLLDSKYSDDHCKYIIDTLKSRTGST